MNHEDRYGKFTSSEIHNILKLDRAKTGFGKPALTYIRSRGIERRLKRSVTSESNDRALTWGKLVETYAFGLLDTGYKLCSQETMQHPKYGFWCGSPDGEHFGEQKAVVEQKCPFTLLSFCQAVDAFNAGGIERLRSDYEYGDKWYWQCVSNAILTGNDYAELIVFCPYQSELSAIRQLAADAPPEEVASYYWMNFCTDKELPYVIEGGHYKNLNALRFPIPEEDKRVLEYAVCEAEKALNPSVLLAHHDETTGVIIVEAA